MLLFPPLTLALITHTTRALQTFRTTETPGSGGRIAVYTTDASSNDAWTGLIQASAGSYVSTVDGSGAGTVLVNLKGASGLPDL